MPGSIDKIIGICYITLFVINKIRLIQTMAL